MGRSITRVVGTLFRDARPLGGVCLAVIFALLAYWLRYAFIEPEKFGAACVTDGPWWCAPRTSLIVATEMNLLGLVAVAAAVLALLPPVRLHVWSAHSALVVGGAGLILYNATFSVAAVVLALLVLALRRQDSA